MKFTNPVTPMKELAEAMRIAYLDCLSGISGDMTLGALVDAGADLSVIQQGIDSLGMPRCELRAETVKRHGFRATKLNVLHEPEHAHRHLHHIRKMIDGSQLTDSQKELANAIFLRLAEAEAKVHGSTIEKVHFHEVGAVDSIADIVGAAIGFRLLGIEEVVCSPVPTGHGTIQIAHGLASVPAPATTELLRGVPLAPSLVEAELTTPTGAAIVSTLARQFGPLPAMTIEQTGAGAGDKDFSAQANILRIYIGERAHAHPQTESSGTTDQVEILETNVDDVTAEIIGHTVDLLREHGALDVYTTPIQMKKNRPGTKITVLCSATSQAKIESILFQETNTLGIRHWSARRNTLPRTAATVMTRWGIISGKQVTVEGITRFSPEYEDCRRVAQEHRVSVQEVMSEALQAFSAASCQ